MSTNSQRMLKTRTQVLLKTHRALAQRPEMLSSLGSELLVAEYRVLRRWLVTGIQGEERESLVAAIKELGDLGIGCGRSFSRRLIDRLLGYRAEWIPLTFFKWCQPAKFALYQKGCN